MSSGEAERAAPSVPTAANDVAQILEGMRQMREELRSVRQGQEETALRIERNARKDTYSFKRRGNELQYRFNAEVADKVAAAATSIEKVETTSIRSKELLDRAARDLREGNALLAHRQRIIKLANRSESGWAVVDEYEGDDLAEDSDDEKRMEKAENRAERKLAKKRKILREARMKDDVGAKSAIPPGALRPFPAKGADVMKGSGTSLLSRHRGSQRAHALNVGILATGGRNALRWLRSSGGWWRMC